MPADDAGDAIAAAVAAMGKLGRVEQGESSISSVCDSLTEISDDAVRESLARLVVATAVLARCEASPVVRWAVLSHLRAESLPSLRESAEVACRARETIEAPRKLALSMGLRRRRGDCGAYLAAAVAMGVEDSAKDARECVRVLLAPARAAEAERRRDELSAALLSAVVRSESTASSGSVDELQLELTDMVTRRVWRGREETCQLALRAACAVAAPCDEAAAWTAVAATCPGGDRCAAVVASCLSATQADEFVRTHLRGDKRKIPGVLLALSGRLSRVEDRKAVALAALKGGALRDVAAACETSPRSVQVLECGVLDNDQVFAVQLFYDDQPSVAPDGRFAVDVDSLCKAWLAARVEPPDSLAAAAAGVFPFEPRPLLRLAPRLGVGSPHRGGSLSRLNASTSRFGLATRSSSSRGGWLFAPDDHYYDDLDAWEPRPHQTFRLATIDNRLVNELRETWPIDALATDRSAVVIVRDDHLPRGAVGMVAAARVEALVVRWTRGVYYEAPAVARQYLDADVDDDLFALSATSVDPSLIAPNVGSRLALFSNDPDLLNRLPIAAARNYVARRRELSDCDPCFLRRVAQDSSSVVGEPSDCDSSFLRRVAQDSSSVVVEAGERAIDALIESGRLGELSDLHRLYPTKRRALLKLAKGAIDAVLREGDVPVVLAADLEVARKLDDDAAFAALLVADLARSRRLEAVGARWFSERIAALLALALGDERRAPSLGPAAARALAAIAEEHGDELRVGSSLFRVADVFFRENDDPVYLECAASLARRAPRLASDLARAAGENTVPTIIAGVLAAEISSSARARLAALDLADALGIEDQRIVDAAASAFATTLDGDLVRTLQMKARCLRYASDDLDDSSVEVATKIAIDALFTHFKPDLLPQDHASTDDERDDDDDDAAQIAAASAYFFAALAETAPRGAARPASMLVRDERFAVLVQNASRRSRSASLLLVANAIELSYYFCRRPQSPDDSLAFLRALKPLLHLDDILRRAATTAALASLRGTTPNLETRIALLSRVDDTDAGLALAAACLRHPLPRPLVTAALAMDLPARAASAARARRDAGWALAAGCSTSAPLAAALVDANFFLLVQNARDATVAACVLGSRRDDDQAWRAAAGAARRLPVRDCLSFFLALSLRADNWRFLAADSFEAVALDARRLALDDAYSDPRLLDQALTLARRLATAAGRPYLASTPPSEVYDKLVDDLDFFRARGVFRPVDLAILAAKLDDEAPSHHLTLALVASCLDYFAHPPKLRHNRALDFDLRALLDRALPLAPPELKPGLETRAKRVRDLLDAAHPPKPRSSPTLHHRRGPDPHRGGAAALATVETPRTDVAFRKWTRRGHRADHAAARSYASYK